MSNFVRDLMKDMKTKKVSDIVKARIISKGHDNKKKEDYYLVQLEGQKFGGILYSSYVSGDLFENIKIGDFVDVIILYIHHYNSTKYYLVSNKSAKKRASLRDLVNEYGRNKKIEATVIARVSNNKYTLSILDGEFTGDYISINKLEKGDKRNVYARINKSRSLSFSDSSYTTIPLKRKQVVDCSIQSITYPDVIVKIKGLENFKQIKYCAIPISDIIRGTEEEIFAYIENNKELKAEVMYVNNGTVMLSCTQLSDHILYKRKHELNNSEKKILVKILSKDDDTRMLYLENKELNISGTLAYYDLGWSRSSQIKKLKELNIGDDIEVTIGDINYNKGYFIFRKENHDTNKFKEIVKDLKVADIIKCTVIDKNDDIYLEYKGSDCILRRYDLAWGDQNCRFSYNKLNIGDELEVKIKSIKKNSILVVLKDLIENEFQNIASQMKYNEYYLCQVSRTQMRRLIVTPIAHLVDDKEQKLNIKEDNSCCFIYLDNMMDSNARPRSLIGKTIKCKLLRIDRYKNILLFSEKHFYEDVDAKAQKQYKSSSSQPTLFSQFDIK